MANITLTKPFFCILTISLFFISSILYQATAAGHDGDGLLAKHGQPKKKQMKQKLSQFKFYWHDILSGKNATAVRIINPVNGSSSYFGLVTMIDDPLTQKSELGSKLLGRAQGFYAGASQKDLALLMVMNFYFMTGKYNGSTISIMGRNPATQEVREMSVIGGTGLFRFARGYAQARTTSFDATTGDAVVQYDVSVMHYVY